MNSAKSSRLNVDIAVVAVATLLFSLSLALRAHVNIWLTIGVSAVLLLATTTFGRGELPLWGRFRPLIGIGIGIGAGVLMAIVTHLAYPLAARLVPSIAVEVAGLYEDLRQTPGPVLGAPFLLLAVAAEEAVWRGVLVRQMEKTRGPLVIVLVATLAYAVPQAFSGSWVLVLVALGCGAFWTFLRVWSRSLVVPALTHAVWNLVVFVALPLH
ncbi:MAG: membrane protease YdiL (CAAX protease family) [Polyangiales bacterium]